MRPAGYLLLFILAAAGFLMLIIATPWGIGASPDSLVYIAGARNLAVGNGFSQAGMDGTFKGITHHAPLYAALLAGLDRLGLDPLYGGRWLNAALFAGLILLIGILLNRLLPSRSKWSLLAVMAGAALVLVSPVLVEIYLMAWSEALFLLLTPAALWLLSGYLETRSPAWLAGAAVVTALACLTRYAGIALAISGGLALLVMSWKKPFLRLIDAAVYGAVSLAPVALWMLRNQFSSGSTTSREIGFHPIGMAHIQQAITTLGQWFFIPSQMPAAVKLLPYILLAGGFVYWYLEARSRRQTKPQGQAASIAGVPAFIWVCLIFVTIYFLFLALSISFLDANTPLDSRILSPVLLIAILLAVFVLERFFSPNNGLGRRLLASILPGAFLLICLLATVALLQSSYMEGLGFSTRAWSRSPLLAETNGLPDGLLIYTNVPEPITLYTHLPAFPLPKKFESANQRENLRFAADMEQVHTRVAAGEAVVVYFDRVKRLSLPTLGELRGEYGLAAWRQAPDGVILGVQPAP